MRNDPFEERRREEREPTADDERKNLRRLWRRMQYDYQSGKRTWDWCLPRIEQRKRLGVKVI